MSQAGAAPQRWVKVGRLSPAQMDEFLRHAHPVVTALTPQQRLELVSGLQNATLPPALVADGAVEYSDVQAAALVLWQFMRSKDGIALATWLAVLFTFVQLLGDDSPPTPPPAVVIIERMPDRTPSVPEHPAPEGLIIRPAGGAESTIAVEHSEEDRTLEPPESAGLDITVQLLADGMDAVDRQLPLELAVERILTFREPLLADVAAARLLNAELTRHEPEPGEPALKDQIDEVLVAVQARLR